MLWLVRKVGEKENFRVVVLTQGVSVLCRLASNLYAIQVVLKLSLPPQPPRKLVL